MADGWTGWQDPNGDAMFVADGQKMPVLVHVTNEGQSEHMLATFASIEAAGEFQEWLNRSFEETAMANNQLSLHVRGVRGAFSHADAREDEGYHGPGRVEE